MNLSLFSHSKEYIFSIKPNILGWNCNATGYFVLTLGQELLVLQWQLNFQNDKILILEYLSQPVQKGLLQIILVGKEEYGRCFLAGRE